MIRNAVAGIALVLTCFAVASQPASSAQGPDVVRKVLMQHDLPMPGWTASLVSVEIPVGGREGRHTHPGPLLVYVQDGAITLDYEGQPTKTYKAGETFYVEAGKIHEGINNGNVAAKAIASFITPKGQPLTAQAK
jgi:quercetin dioxygenase-like cupin family protein